MKYSAAAVAAVMATGALAQPAFTNSDINPTEGKPFTLTFDGCSAGCTITLQSGPSPTQLSDIRTLTTDATKSFVVTLSDLTSGTYNFKITSNADKTTNYSTQFSYVGTGPTSSATCASSSSATSSSRSSSSTDSSATSSSTKSSSSASATDSSSTSASATSTSSHSSKTTSATSSTKPTSTTPPNAGSVASLSPFGLIAAAAAALFL